MFLRVVCGGLYNLDNNMVGNMQLSQTIISLMEELASFEKLLDLVIEI